MTARHVMIIGVEPPCPRCAFLGEMVETIKRNSTADFDIVHTSFESDKAQAIASDNGLEAGTAKHVAARLGCEVDWDHVYSLITNPPPCELTSKAHNEMARKWSPALDESLQSLQKAARKVGILMTPVLVVDGEVKHEGSVPSPFDIRKWFGLDK